jgi:apolipoprotein N-acyltransferase
VKKPQKFKVPKDWELLKLVITLAVTALMLTLIQPPIGWSFLAWVSFVPFILACSPEAKPKTLALVAYIVSLVYWLGNLYWVFPITKIGWFALCVYIAIPWPLLALCLRYCRTKRIPLFLCSAVLVVGAERLQGAFLGGFFWRFLGHSQYHNITLIQIADIFGTAGVSLLVALVNGLVAELIIAWRHRNLFKAKTFINTAIVSAAVIAAIVYGRWRIEQSDVFVEEGPLVASLQSNIPQSIKRTFQASDKIFDDLMQDSKASTQAGAELIVWPETMVQGILDADIWPYLVSPEEYEAFDQALREHAKGTAFVLVGAYGAEIKVDDNQDISLARYNSAFLYRPDGKQDRKRYDKIHLVLFGEYLPFKKSCSWLYNLLMKFTPFNYDYSLDSGSEYTVFEMPNPPSDLAQAVGTGQENSDNAPTGTAVHKQTFSFGVIICYEDTIPAIARRYALDEHGQKRIDWLVNLSNDGWFVRFKDEPEKVKPSAELTQHAAICAFRAVENRVAILRSVNTGISCLIDSLGQIRDGYVRAGPNLPVKAMERKGMAGWFVDRMPIDKRVTFFSRYGQWLDFCCATCLILLIIVQFVLRLSKTKNGKLVFRGKSNETYSRES